MARPVCVVVLAGLLAACSHAPSAPPIGSDAASAEGSSGWLAGIGSLAGKALEAVGLKPPEQPELPPIPEHLLPERRITWKLHASTSLNADAQGRGLSLVQRIYRLKSPDAFLQAPADTFGDMDKEKALLQDDLVAVRDVQQMPGQQLEITEKVPRDVGFVGIVALFHNPAQGRWRYAFSAAEAERTGLQIGAHACALTVQSGEPIGLPLSAVRSAAFSCR